MKKPRPDDKGIDLSEFKNKNQENPPLYDYGRPVPKPPFRAEDMMVVPDSVPERTRAPPMPSDAREQGMPPAPPKAQPIIMPAPPPDAPGPEMFPPDSVPEPPRPNSRGPIVSPSPEPKSFGEPVRGAPTESIDTKSMPPLFIKIERYNGVIESLHRLKAYSLTLRDALDALSEIQKELHSGFTIAHRALDKFNNTISMLDAKLSNVKGKAEIEKMSEEIRAETPGEIDEYVKDIYEQLERVKGELNNIKA